MSKTFPASPPTATPTILKSAPAHQKFKNGSDLDSTTATTFSDAPATLQPKAITSSARVANLSPVHRYARIAPQEQNSLLLTERESIFATNYTPTDNDSTTPPLSAVEGTTDTRSFLEGVTKDMDVALHPLHASADLALRPLMLAKRAQSSGTTNVLDKTSTSPPAKSSLAQILPESGLIRGVRRVSSEDQNHARRFHVLVNRSATSDKRMSNHASEKIGKSRPAAPNLQTQEEDVQNAVRTSAMKDAMRQDGRSERSTSRGRTQIDKTIEATLAKTEAGKNVRSRKSSHYMQLFKEDEISDEALPHDSQKSKDEAFKSLSRETDNISQVPRPRIDKDSARRDQRETPRGASEIPAHNDVYGLGTRDLFISSDLTPNYLTTQAESITGGDFSASSPGQHSVKVASQDRHLQIEPSFEVAGLASDPHRSRPPINATEEGNESAPELPPVEKARKPLAVLQIPTSAIADDDGEQEEHIAAAVYFPHAGHTDEEIEHFVALDDPHSGTVAESLEQDVARRKEGSLKVQNESEEHDTNDHFDVSVSDIHQRQLWHGDYRRTRTSGHPAIDTLSYPPGWEHALDTASSASESELESEPGEESKPAAGGDEGETTPTATPKPNSHLQMSKRRASSFQIPIGAVVLEPYSHQVGGHSTVFRFSRRAVCKQLNNRENEFYERIELRHPDMLKFLPRYIGVLNVTFSKGPKRSKAIDNGIDTKLVDRDASQEIGVKATDGSKEGKQPRIVSQSQKTDGTAQVILDQNRHIIPMSLFGSPERPRSADPHHHLRKGAPTPPFSNGTPRHNLPETLAMTSAKSLTRPPPPEHTTSWGTSTVNQKLREQVLREVFGPPLVHHRKHGRNNHTLPRIRATGDKRRSNLPPPSPDDGDITASIPAQTSPISNLSLALQSENKLQRDRGASTASLNSSIASLLDDDTNRLEKVKTAESLSSREEVVSAERPIRRRRSGMGLKRRRKSVHGGEQVDLEYFEDEDATVTPQAGRRNEDTSMFNMDVEDMDPPGKQYANLQDQGDVSSRSMSSGHDAELDQKSNSSDEATQLTHQVNELTRGGSKVVSGPIPQNPKEAQAATPDQRAQLYLLLEDLTTGMGRPCVLDLKMGTRQYGVYATEKKMKSQRNKCKTTTSQQLGVRICGMQGYNSKEQRRIFEDKYFGRDITAGKEFREALTRFLYDGVSYASVARHIPVIIDKLNKLETMIRNLPGYRFYASSLLLIYDASPEKSTKAKEEAAKEEKRQNEGLEQSPKHSPKHKRSWPPPIQIRLVDFANCITAEDGWRSEATYPPSHPDDIDRGYLRGLRTLKAYFRRILRDLSEEEFVERGEGEAMAIGIRRAIKNCDVHDVESPEQREEGYVSI